MNLDFDKIWASDTSPDYPSDTQTKRGLSYLGTEPPTFDLHDAIFQRLDKKDQWLYDQVRLACERFGQNVSESVAGASRDTMANAITNALLTQRKADEGGYGIIKMANADQTNAGQEYNLAVSPRHLAEYVAAKNTWESTQNKPQTATRWPAWDEVSSKPSWGSAAWKDASEFDPAGSASSAVSDRVTRDGITVAGFINGDKDGGAYFRSTDGTIIGITRNDQLDRYIKKAAETYVSRDGIGVAGFMGGVESGAPYFRALDTGTVVTLAKSTDFDDFKKTLGTASSKNTEDFDPSGAASTAKNEAISSCLARDGARRAGFVNGNSADPYLEHWDGTNSTVVRLARSTWVSSVVSGLVSQEGITALGKSSDGSIYAKDSSSNSYTLVRSSDLSAGAYMWKSSAGVDGLIGDAREVMTTAQGVELRNMTVRKVRLGQSITYDMQSNIAYSQSGHVISSLRITGAVDGSMDSITLRPIQYLINGTWYTAEQV